MQMESKRIIYFLYRAMTVVLLTFVVSGCGSRAQKVVTQETDETVKKTPYVRAKADSLDEAVISKINEQKKKITFYNTTLGLEYTLTYEGISSIKDKYDEELSVSQLAPGDLVITSFVKDDKELRTIQLKKDAFVLDGVSDYEINKTALTMRISDKRYQLAGHLFVLANGTSGALEDINSVDVLRVSGTERFINSIVIEKGHGYLRLTGDEYFIGGWIEVGESLIRPISEGMLLTVPEGEYDVIVTNKGYGGSRHVTIEANKETTIDIADLKGDEVRTGKLIFTITPTSAVLTIDGKETGVSAPVTLEYGIHKIVLKADGYKTMVKYIKVSSPLANINIEMEAGQDDDGSVSGNNAQSAGKITIENPKTDESASGGQTSETGSGGSETKANPGTSFIGDTAAEDTGANDDASAVEAPVTDAAQGPLVYIDSPVGAQLYVDGVYVGIVPVNFSKTAGNHEVSLRKEGYQTRSYTLYFDSGENNLTFSFAELAENP